MSSFSEHLQARFARLPRNESARPLLMISRGNGFACRMAVLSTINFMETATLTPPRYSNHCPQSETTSKPIVLQ